MNLAEAFKNRRVQIGLAALALTIVVVISLLFIFKPTSPATSPSASPTDAGSVTATQTAVSDPSAPATSAPGTTCINPDGLGFTPVRYAIESLGVDADVLALGTLGIGDDALIPAPPKDQPKTAAWWNGGPAPASSAGQVVLSIHTYQNGNAVGNQLFADGESKLKAGDVIKLWDAEGNMACYEYVEAEKINVSDFDPESDKLVRLEGDPALAIIICWDHNKETDEWDSRVFFRFKPVTEAA